MSVLCGRCLGYDCGDRLGARAEQRAAVLAVGGVRATDPSDACAELYRLRCGAVRCYRCRSGRKILRQYKWSW